MPLTKADLRDLFLNRLEADGDALYSSNPDIQKYKPDLSVGAGDEIYDANYAAWNYIAEAITDWLETNDRSFAAFEAYYTGTSQIYDVLSAVSFNNTRVIDAEYSFDGTTITINTDGQYIIDYSLGAIGGSGTRLVEADLYLNGSVVPGTRTNLNWSSANTTSGASTRTILDLTSGDELELRAERVSGSGTLSVLENATALAITRAED